MARSKQEWLDLIARLEEGARTDDTEHALWCAGQLRVVRRRFARAFPPNAEG